MVMAELKSSKNRNSNRAALDEDALVSENFTKEDILKTIEDSVSQLRETAKFDEITLDIKHFNSFLNILSIKIAAEIHQKISNIEKNIIEKQNIKNTPILTAADFWGNDLNIEESYFTPGPQSPNDQAVSTSKETVDRSKNRKEDVTEEARIVIPNILASSKKNHISMDIDEKDDANGEEENDALNNSTSPFCSTMIDFDSQKDDDQKFSEDSLDNPVFEALSKNSIVNEPCSTNVLNELASKSNQFYKAMGLITENNEVDDLNENFDEKVSDTLTTLIIPITLNESQMENQNIEMENGAEDVKEEEEIEDDKLKEKSDVLKNVDSIIASVGKLVNSPEDKVQNKTANDVPSTSHAVDDEKFNDLNEQNDPKKVKKNGQSDDEAMVEDDLFEGYQVLNDDDTDEEPFVEKKKKRKITNLDESENEYEASQGSSLKRPNNVINSDSETTEQKISKDSDSLSDNEGSTKSKESKKPDKNKKKRRKRRRVVVLSDGADSSQSDFDDEIKDDDDNDSSKDNLNSTRKKIRNIIHKANLQKDTKNAEKAEKERRKRVEEKQKLYNNHFTKNIESDQFQQQELILDFDKETKEVLVSINTEMVKKMKKHQIDGVKFLYDATIEGVDLVKKGDKGSGCILAHSMGLGKTFQVIAYVCTLLNNEHIKGYINKVLIIVPKNVIRNWANEFYMWFDECNIERSFEIFEINNEKRIDGRMRVCQEWYETGGVLIITTHMFQNLLLGKKMSKSQRGKLPTFEKCLRNPGPDIVVFDEGHLVKNENSQINKVISEIATRRRIMLTGTPLQNNLGEYYVMVNFVKPNLLGTRKEFTNRFENPINNGQMIDSSDNDVKLMKKRVHILHRLLNDCVHRCDYNVLVPYLQPKFEYVLALKMLDIQVKLYKYYLDAFIDRQNLKSTLFRDYVILGYIWNHPALLKNHYERKIQEELEREDEDSLNRFVVDDDASLSDSSGVEFLEEKVNNPDAQRLSENNSGLKMEDGEEASSSNTENTNLFTWFEQFLPEDAMRIELSSKFILLFSILEKCEILGDKLLIFSQSLNTLDLIENMLKMKMIEFQNEHNSMDYYTLLKQSNGVSHSWCKGIDYFRIDGNVNTDNRSNMIEELNDPTNRRARLMLISTKAGGLGINLIGANRCIIFDTSWNPSHDLQAIYRIFRYGQEKPVYVYRFTAFGTMENKIYERQIIKQSLSHRVVDEQQIQRHYRSSDLSELYKLTLPSAEQEVFTVPKDLLLADMIYKHKELIVSYHEHDSLLENKPEEGLSEDERKQAWNEYEAGLVAMEERSAQMIDPSMYQSMMNNQQQVFDLTKYPQQWLESLNQFHSLNDTTVYASTSNGYIARSQMNMTNTMTQVSTSSSLASAYAKYYQNLNSQPQIQNTQAKGFSILQSNYPQQGTEQPSRVADNDLQYENDLAEELNKKFFGPDSKLTVLKLKLTHLLRLQSTTLKDQETLFKRRNSVDPDKFNEIFYQFLSIYYFCCHDVLNYLKQGAAKNMSTKIFKNLRNSFENIRAIREHVVNRGNFSKDYQKKLDIEVMSVINSKERQRLPSATSEDVKPNISNLGSRSNVVTEVIELSD